MDGQRLKVQHKIKDVAELLRLYRDNALDLSPAFQRKSVWTKKDRKRLIETVIRNYPIPALFLYRKEERGEVIYSVIDGKQRLEALLGFLGELPGLDVDVAVELPGTEGEQKFNGKAFRTKKEFKERHYPEFLAYQIPLVEVAGDLSDIVELFVGINSTGKALSPQERRHARFSGSNLLVEATRLADKFSDYFLSIRTFSEQQMRRMKHVEFIAELLVSVDEGGPIHKKASVDRVMAKDTMKDNRWTALGTRVASAIGFVQRLAPDIRETRFKQTADLYSLIVLFDRLARDGAVMAEKTRNVQAWEMLKAFGVSVDKLNERNRKTRTPSEEEQLFQDYLMTVVQGSDALQPRKRRHEILCSVVETILSQKDTKRAFNPLQRRILWNTSEEKKCSYPGCKTKLDWTTFTMDHIDPHSKGGRTRLDNAALMCRAHNASKGNARLAR